MPWNPCSAIKWMGGQGYMYDGGLKVAIIRKVQIRHPAGVLWRSVSWEEKSEDRVLLGYFPTMEMAAAVTWRLWLQRGKPPEETILL